MKTTKATCAKINCTNSTYKLKKMKEELCYEHNDFDSSCKREHYSIVYHYSNYTAFEGRKIAKEMHNSFKETK